MIVGCAVLAAVASSPVLPAYGSPATSNISVARDQNVDWLGAETASSLNLGFTVLVPGGVPGPFGGDPSVSTSGGYYSLYWMIPGGDPTFLQITGQVGGALPAGSPYDLNNQLFINASVQGYDAIHDVTPIYDQVWWIADGVLYTVSSRNLSDTDSLSLANSLFALIPPDGGTNPEIEPTVDPGVPDDGTSSQNESVGLETSVSNINGGDTLTVSVNNAVNVNLDADGGVFTATGSESIQNLNSGSFDWTAPTVDAQTTITFTVTDPQSGSSYVSATVTVAPTVDAGGQQTGETTQDDVANDETSSVTPTPANQQETTLSDGTGGPPPPVIGGDGTGGSQTVSVPRGDGTREP